MHEFKIHKALDKQPLIFGLEFNAFKIFAWMAIPLILLGLIHVSSSEGMKRIMILFGVYMGLIAIAYIASSFVTRFNISKKLSDDQFPDQILNNL